MVPALRDEEELASAGGEVASGFDVVSAVDPATLGRSGGLPEGSEPKVHT
jgi:hypothetical protein